MNDENEIMQAVKGLGDGIKEFKHGTNAKLLEIEQKIAARLGGSRGLDGGNDEGELTRLIVESDGYLAFKKGAAPNFEIKVPRHLLKTQIINAPGQNQPLVPAWRVPGIGFAPQIRLTIRDLFEQTPTDSNLVEFVRETAFTNAARPQGSVSPGGVEGELKAESAMTFALSNTPVITLAHWIPASRQVLSDAPMLQGHISGRLLYGLKLEEEAEILTGDGTAGKLNGVNNQAAPFTGGVTNAGALDTLARAATQLIVAGYQPSGFILNPADWLAIQLLKDTTGRYLLADPALATQPQLWGLPVIVTPSQTLGRFTVIDAQRFGFIADRETALIRISENMGDYFVRNMIAILCEERLAFVCENGSAAVYGVLNNAG